ncbi:YlbL family protein [Paenibacillus aquistagni]|uniref:endopeptidase La n=1 Tax=Paenibacillus aquistagni TaxID=1852522 RepID=A0A1X7IMG5_9BACL|nr:PDZ domain-containing protein [Paenibacillus aquistagni]SMG15554.1 PDZ domain-containing protein [Paenibacillus aquistagni]
MVEKHMQDHRNQRGNWTVWRWLIVCLLVVYVVVFMPTPYVIYTPGSAEPVKPMVQVGQDDVTESGTFMLTTVRRTYANIALLGIHSFDDNAQIAKKEDALRGRSEAEYNTELVFSMTGSQSNAILAAYNYAKIPYNIEQKGLYVIANLPDIAKNTLKTNDRIVEVEGHTVNQVKELQAIIKEHRVGDTLNVVVERDGKKEQASATLVSFTSSLDKTKKQIGFGIQFGEKTEVVPTKKEHVITFKDNNIGGPSAGLMFTLELINRLTPGDLSRGLRIAGTGEITPDGEVGIIGGIQHKVVAADREGAELFLAPEGNYKEAKAKVDKMKTNMKVVSVRTLQDALDAIETFQK